MAGFRARFGLVVEGITGQNLGPGLTLEDAIVARQTVLISLNAATYPALGTMIGAWVLLDLVRVAARNDPDPAWLSSTSSPLSVAKVGTLSHCSLARAKPA